jgi:CubicO group peptidase (beta-lactamase class C family)
MITLLSQPTVALRSAAHKGSFDLTERGRGPLGIVISLQQAQSQMESARVRELLNRRPAVGMAIGVVSEGSLEFFHAHGVADVASRNPINSDTVFRIASITKTFTAIAVMQLWERGLVDLDAPANDYLRGFRLVLTRTSFGPATVRHLLTHTAGIAELRHPSDLFRRLFGETVKADDPVKSLREYYHQGLQIDAEPGSRFAYTDHGFATLGQLIEDVSGRPLGQYFREQIFEPLGMANTDMVRSERTRPRLATGYDLGRHGAKPVTDYEMVPAAASSAYSTPRDMAQYLAALLGGGSNEHGSVLKPDTVAAMFEPHYQPDPRVPGIGLGFWRGEIGGHRIVEHGGILPGFNSQIFLAPDDDVGVMTFTNGARNAMLWLPGETAELLSERLGVPNVAVRTDIPHQPEIWTDLCGRYYLPARLTDARAREMAGAGVEVFVRRGRLMLRILTPVPAMYRGFPLHPDDEQDPYVFRIDLSAFGIGTMRVIFGRRPETGRMAVHLDVMPLSAEKRSSSESARTFGFHRRQSEGMRIVK